MLEALIKFGGYRVDRFIKTEQSGAEFGFYLCSWQQRAGNYCLAAKHQLQYGLVQLHVHDQIKNLAGIYIDINLPEQLNRPAYLELKRDIQQGRFQRVLVLDERLIGGNCDVERDWQALMAEVPGLEFFTFERGELMSISVQHKREFGIVR
jgi:hypothetical protein